MVELYAAHDRLVGTKQTFIQRFSKVFSQKRGCSLSLSLLLVFDHDADQPAKWRVVELFSFRELHTEECFIIVAGNIRVNGLCRVGTLNDDDPLFVVSSGTSRCLCHKLESPFMGSKIGIVQQ